MFCRLRYFDADCGLLGFGWGGLGFDLVCFGF